MEAKVGLWSRRIGRVLRYLNFDVENVWEYHGQLKKQANGSLNTSIQSSHLRYIWPGSNYPTLHTLCKDPAFWRRLKCWERWKGRRWQKQDGWIQVQWQWQHPWGSWNKRLGIDCRGENLLLGVKNNFRAQSQVIKMVSEWKAGVRKCMSWDHYDNLHPASWEVLVLDIINFSLRQGKRSILP